MWPSPTDFERPFTFGHGFGVKPYKLFSNREKRSAGKTENWVQEILDTEIPDPEILDPEKLVPGNPRPRNPSARKT